MSKLKLFFQHLRQLSGDDAYERYLDHYAKHHATHADAPVPLTRTAFFKQWQDQKWNGVKRCC